MRYLIRHLHRGPGGSTEYRDVDGSEDVIDIGSGAQQLVRLTGKQIAPEHARIVRGLTGQIQLRALGDNTFEHNGTTATRASLAANDKVVISGNIIKVLPTPSGFDIALSVAHSGEIDATASYVIHEGTSTTP